MEDLFRLITIRPPQKVDPSTVSIAYPTALQERLATAGQQGAKEKPEPVTGVVASSATPQERLELARRGERLNPRTVLVDRPTAPQEKLENTPPAGAHPRNNPGSDMEEIAKNFRDQANYVTNASNLRFGKELVKLRDRLLAIGQIATPADVEKEVQGIFHMTVAKLASHPDFRADMARVYDSILATYIAPPTDGGSLTLLIELAQTLGLIDRLGSKDDPTINEPGGVVAALNATPLLPEWMCPDDPDRFLPIRPVGVADLLVVKQHLKAYELGDIARIENVLQGESRMLTRKHTLSTEQISVTEIERITEEQKELEIEERFALKRETENTLKEDTSVKSGLSLSAKYGESLQVNANVNVDYSNSKSEAVKTAAEYAKNVTSRAASKVTERFREQITRRVIETFEETDEQGFDNKNGQGNVVGIYQWVNKVYEAQVFNYGERKLLDMMIPEPAAFLLDAVDTREKNSEPIPPLAFTVDGTEGKASVLPKDLSSDPNSPYYFGHFVARYGAAGVTAAPVEHITVSAAYSGRRENDKDPVGHSDIEIPVGYEAIKAFVQGVFDPAPGASWPIQLNVLVGTKLIVISDVKEPNGPDAPGLRQEVSLETDEGGKGGYREGQKLPVAYGSYNVDDYALTVDVYCELRDEVLQDWQVKTYDAILQAFNKLKGDYEERIAAQTFQRGTQPLIGGNPELNRRTERVELKKACIAMLLKSSGKSLTDFNGVLGHTEYYLPNPVVAQEDGKWIRFFEQAFEWEHMMYHFYPYFWGRKHTWYDQVLRQNDDPQFLDFLRAGEARVVVPVRPTFEPNVLYYLCRGQPWGGGDLPSITDKRYLPITEEIKEATGARGTEKPQGEPWEIRIPTSLIKLRQDGKLPGWKRTGDWDWKADPPDA